MSRWTAECQDGPQNVEMDRRMSRWTAECRDGPQNVKMDRRMSRWTAECRDGPQNVKMDRRMSRRTTECRDGPQNVAMESTPESTGPMTLLGPGPESGATFLLFCFFSSFFLRPFAEAAVVVGVSLPVRVEHARHWSFLLWTVCQHLFILAYDT